MFSSPLPPNYTNFDDTFLCDGWNLDDFPNNFYQSNKKNLIIISPKEYELPYGWMHNQAKLEEFNRICQNSTFGVDIIFGGLDINYHLLNKKINSKVRYHLWPLYWITKKAFDYKLYNTTKGKDPSIKFNISKPYAFLNNQRKIHRILMMNE